MIAHHALQSFDREALDRLPALVWSCLEDGMCDYLNARWVDYTGIPEREQHGLGWLQALHPDDRASTERAWLRANAGDASYDLQYRIRAANGTYRWFKARGVRVETASGLRWFGVSTDIDDERRAREKLEFLGAVSTLLAKDAEPGHVIPVLLRMLVPAFADFAALDLFDDGGAFVEVFVEADPVRAELIRALRTRYAEIADHAGTAWDVARNGIPLLGAELNGDGTCKANPPADARVRELMAGLRKRSSTVLPLSVNGRSIGALTLYRSESPEPYAIADLPFLLDLAGRVALATSKGRVRRALIESEERYRLLTDTLPHLVGVSDETGTVRYLNRSWADYTGLHPTEASDSAWAGIVHPDDVAALQKARAAALVHGESYEHQYRLRGKDGSYRWFLGRTSPVRDGSGKIVQWIGTATDIDERKRSEDVVRLVADATSLLTLSLDTRTTLQRLCEVAIASLADWCAVYVLDDAGVLQPAAIAHEDPQQIAYTRELLRRYPAREDDGSYQVLRNGEPLLVERITPEMIDAGAIDAEHAEQIRGLHLHSIVIVALGNGDERFGVLHIATAESGRTLGPQDVEVAKLLAQRASTAIGNARLYERQERVARTLQDAFLPASLPEVEKATFNAVYAPGMAEAEIGGDWYDAATLDGGEVVLSIGDVAGRGLAAAIPMGKMRQAFRALTVVERDPATLLSIGDSVLRREHPDVFVTAIVATYTPSSGMLRYANAGHPPPVVRRYRGALERLTEASLPLGLHAFGTNATHHARLGAGDLLVLYTDGLIESTHDIAAGEAALDRALAHPAAEIASDPAAYQRAVLLPERANDDVAILTLRAVPPDEHRWSFDAYDSLQAQQARAFYAQALREHDVGEDDALRFEIVFGELIGNAARYTPGPIDLALRDEPDGLVLHALDQGRGFAWNDTLPADILSERGRGLFLMSALAQAIVVEYLPNYGSYTRITLRP